MNPDSDAQRQTILAVMIKMKVQDRIDSRNCQHAADLLKEKWFLNIYPDPFEPARGPASDLSPIEDEIQLKILSVAKNEITDIKPLAKLKDLTQLNVNYNPLSNITVLQNFRVLEEFFATDTAVTDLQPLSSAKRLRVLSLAKNGIDNILPLKDLNNLKALYLSDNHIADASVIKGLALEYLHLGNNRISELDVTQSKESMILLDVAKNRLAAIDGLSQLAKIDALNIADNDFAALGDLKALKSLRWLDVRRNKISDISSLAELRDLEYLYLAGNSICRLPDDVAALQVEHQNSKGEWMRLEISGLDEQVGCL
jgi:internalin A